MGANEWIAFGSLLLLLAGMAGAVWRTIQGAREKMGENLRREISRIEEKLTDTRTTLFALKEAHELTKQQLSHHEEICQGRQAEISEMKADIKSIRGTLEDMRVTIMSWGKQADDLPKSG